MRFHIINRVATLDKSNKEELLEENDYIAVVGKGMLNNNTLLPQLLNCPVSRWYPWHSFSKFFNRNTFLKKKIYTGMNPYSTNNITINPTKNQTNNKVNTNNKNSNIKNSLPTAFAGWGRKKSYQRALIAAKFNGVKALSVEDGFLRSITSGIDSRYSCSIVIDELGIYFDTLRPSSLENHIIENLHNWSVQKQKRATHCIEQMCAYHLSKYNQSVTCFELSNVVSADEHVLVIDQVVADASIKGAGLESHRHSRKQFLKMLRQACHKHPKAHIWIKAHPAAKTGYLNHSKFQKKLSKTDLARISIIDTQVNPIKLLQQVSNVYTISSHMGFEALLLNKKVHCFGVAWYTGWGLTDDKYAPKKLYKKVVKRRQRLPSKLNGLNKEATIKPTVKQLFYAAYIDYSRYADPASLQSCEIEQVIHWLNTNRAWYVKLSKQLTIYEFSRWKLPFVKDFLNIITASAESKLIIKPKPRLKNLLHPKHYILDYGHEFLVWGLASRRKLEGKLGKVSSLTPPHVPKTKIWCMEDGFIRSNGLGATLLPPLSVVLDGQGIYYDASVSSDLESMLQHCDPLLPTEKIRVCKLQQRLREARVSKYHTGRELKLEVAPSIDQVSHSVQPILNKHITSLNSKLDSKHDLMPMLIVGQVEDDLSVQNCASDIITNADLIKLVRELNPKAYLIYKPHPDVEAGLRTGKVDKETLKLVDQVAINIAMPACLDAVQEVHTISSLTGFEALLRGKQVTCYGMPFYAGWGLTHDVNPRNKDRQQILARRRRTQPLTLEQLVHCVLIRYPMYRLSHGHGLAQVEQVIDYLYGEHNSDQDKAGQIDTISPHLTNKSFSDYQSLAKRILAKKIMQTRHRILNMTRFKS